MTLGGSNTPLEASEIDVPSIVESATEHISLDGSGNVNIPNGAIDLNGNNLENPAYIGFDNQGNILSRTDSLRINVGSTYVSLHDNTNNQEILNAKEGGNVEIPNGDLRLATGQSIEDGSGNTRFTFRSQDTLLHDDGGDSKILLRSGTGTIQEVEAGNTWKINDKESGGVGARYDTDASAGVLRTPKAGVVVNSQNTSHGSDGMEFRWTGTESVIDSVNRSGTFSRSPIGINGSTVKLNSFGGLIDASANPANLRLATGQAIEDGSGTNRLSVLSTSTNLVDEDGFEAFQGIGGVENRFHARVGQPAVIRDNEGAFTGVQYDPDASAGVLRTPNAGARIESDGTVTTGEGMELNYNGTTGIVQTYDRSNTVFKDLSLSAGTIKLRSDDGLIDASPKGSDLRLATGQSIEDGSGVERLSVNSSNTVLKDDTGATVLNTKSGNYTRLQAPSGLIDMSIDPANLRLATGQSIEDGSASSRMALFGSGTYIYNEANETSFRASDGSFTRLRGYSDQPIQLYDGENASVAVHYDTSATAPGTLSLDNASINMRGNSVSSAGQYDYNSTSARTFADSNEEVVAEDGAGNQTILT